MGPEVELFCDEKGLAVVGESTAIERFMASAGMALSEVNSGPAEVLAEGSAIAQLAAQAAAESGRWLKLTAESAAKVEQLGLMPTRFPGISHAMVGQPGRIDSWIQIVDDGMTSGLANPGNLAGVAGVMTQLALQAQMQEIAEYLQAIDAKLDHVLRSQTNQVLARLDGVDLAVREAQRIREGVGRVSDVTWSKIESSVAAIHETQGYALRELSDLADQLEDDGNIAALLDAAQNAETNIKMWLLVLARCFELHDAVAVLELDRVLDTAPEEVEQHRLGLVSAREDRLALISDRTQHLLERTNEAAARANSKVLFNPRQSPAVVESSQRVAGDVYELREVLGVEAGRKTSDARRWRDAAAERWEHVRAVGEDGLEDLKRIGGGSVEAAGSLKDRLSKKLSERRRRRAEDD